MKRIISVILCLLMLLPVITVFAAEDFSGDREEFDDGSYIIVFSAEEENSPAGFFMRILEFFRKLLEFFTGQKSVQGTKYAEYYSSDGELLWKAELTAEFLCSKKEAVCVNAELTTEIYDSDWRLVFSETRKELNAALADVTVQQYKLGVPLKAIEKSIIIECSPDGQLK